jgi:neutral ceramidase
MKTSRFLGLTLGVLLLVLPSLRAGEAPDTTAWKAGAVSVDITPQGPVWLVGFGNRTKPSDSIAHPLYAKFLALEDYAGARMVFITLDLLGIPVDMRKEVVRQASAKFQLGDEAILINGSHTHSGPSVQGGGVADPTFRKKGEEYGQMLTAKLVQGMGDALAKLEPVKLHYTRARAGFAMNRRLQMGNEVINSPNPEGPVDHDVPVLRVVGRDNNLRAILFGYACHNTTANFQSVNGDYAGFAQAYLQENRPGVVALFMMGAGADQNPYPRHVNIEQAQQHGRALANAVETALSVRIQRTINGPLRSAYGTVDIDYAEIGRDDLHRRARSKNQTEKTRAEALLRQLDGPGIPKSYPAPVQVVRFGPDLTLIAISGETTVDYSLRLKRELAGGSAAIWVAGYSNDYFGYLGSREVILGGGYEGYSANLGRHPGPWAVSTEDRVINKAYELLQAINR